MNMQYEPKKQRPGIVEVNDEQAGYFVITDQWLLSKDLGLTPYEFRLLLHYKSLAWKGAVEWWQRVNNDKRNPFGCEVASEYINMAQDTVSKARKSLQDKGLIVLRKVIRGEGKFNHFYMVEVLPTTRHNDDFSRRTSADSATLGRGDRYAGRSGMSKSATLCVANSITNEKTIPEAIASTLASQNTNTTHPAPQRNLEITQASNKEEHTQQATLNLPDVFGIARSRNKKEEMDFPLKNNGQDYLPRRKAEAEIMPVGAASDFGAADRGAGMALDSTETGRHDVITAKTGKVPHGGGKAPRNANLLALATVDIYATSTSDVVGGEIKASGMSDDQVTAVISAAHTKAYLKEQVAALGKAIFECGMSSFPSFSVHRSGNNGFTKREFDDQLSLMLTEGMEAGHIVSLFIAYVDEKRTWQKDKSEVWPVETKGILTRGLADFGHIAVAGKPYVAGNGKQKFDVAAWPQVAGLEQVFESLSRQGTVQNAIRTINVWDNTPLDPPVWQSDFEIVRQLTPEEVAIFNPLRDEYLAAYETTRKANGTA